MSDSRTGVNGQVVIDPNEVLGIERDTDPSVDGVSVLLWPGRWRIRARSLAGTGSGAADVSWGAITGKPATFPPDTEATQDVVGSMIAGAGGTYDDTAGTITLPAGGGGAVSSVAGRTGAVVLSSADLTDAASLATDAELPSGLATKANSSHTHDPDPEPTHPAGYVGPWSADADYTVGNVVDRSGRYYRAKVAHGAAYAGTWGPPLPSVWDDLGPVA